MHALVIHQQNVLQLTPEHAKRASAQRITHILTCPTCQMVGGDMVAEREFYMDSQVE
jgi:hypothetical protein